MSEPLTTLQSQALTIIEQSRQSQDERAYALAQASMSKDEVLLADTSYRTLAEAETYALSNFVRRDYRKRFLPFLSCATKGFSFVPAPGTMQYIPGGSCIKDATDTLVSPLYFAIEPDRVDSSSTDFVPPELVSGWRISVPYRTHLPEIGFTRATKPQFSLEQVVQSTDPQDGSTPQVTTKYCWPHSKLVSFESVEPPVEDPDDDTYRQQFQLLRGIHVVLRGKTADSLTL